MAKKIFTYEDMPKEVMEYLAITTSTEGLMGLKLYNRCQEIIERNHEWFKWEIKYRSLPKEIHENYLDEKFPERNKPFSEKIEMKGNIINLDLSKEALDKFSIADAIKEMYEQHDKKIKERIEKKKKDKLLWDKHYKKYRLEFRD